MRISKYCRVFFRWKLNCKNRKRLKNNNFSVLSSNCVGGMMLHELGLQFNSPTVNLSIHSADYIKLLRNLDYYLECELTEVSSDKNYPIGALDDIYIHFLHYSSFEEAKRKWVERSKRIYKDNLYVIMVQKDGCTDEIVKEFDGLPYCHKVIFTSKDYPDIKSAFHIPNSEKSDGEVMNLLLYKSEFSGKRWLDEYDYVEFFNS